MYCRGAVRVWLDWEVPVTPPIRVLRVTWTRRPLKPLVMGPQWEASGQGHTQDLVGVRRV